jgi:phage baseplate assembly protein W
VSGSSLAFPLATWFGGPITQQGPKASALGVDIYFGEPGMIVSAIGDWAKVSGEANVRAYILRRLITNPGDIKARPNWGCGLARALYKPFTDSLRRELVARITAQIPDDPRVRKLGAVDILRDTINTVPVFRVPIVVQTVGDEVGGTALISERRI